MNSTTVLVRSAMASIFADFDDGQRRGYGPRLAASLVPVAPAEHPDRLHSFYNAYNASSLSSDLRYSLFHMRNLRLPKQEQTTWIEIFSAYWKAAGEIIAVHDPNARGSWERTFDAWRDVANALIRGYTSGSLEAWSLPCLYVVGKYLRLFAIYADKEIRSQDSVGFGGRFQDDMITDSDNPKLEEAARIINRMFTLCLNDRYVSGWYCSALMIAEDYDQGAD